MLTLLKFNQLLKGDKSAVRELCEPRHNLTSLTALPILTRVETSPEVSHTCSAVISGLDRPVPDHGAIL